MRAVATDGHRLARIEVPMPEGAAAMPGIIIPRKTIGELRKLCESSRRKRAGGLVGNQNPLSMRQRHAGFQTHRRHLPGLRTRHPLR